MCIRDRNLPVTTYQAHTSPMQSHINVGFGSDVTIAEVAQAIRQAVGFQGTIAFDTTKPDVVQPIGCAAPQRCSSRMAIP